MRRASTKEAIEHKLNARQVAAPLNLTAAAPDVDEVEFRKVKVTGEFVSTWPIYLDNRPHKGAAGLYLVMPLKIAGTNQYVLVMRGWLPRNPADRNQLPAVPTPPANLTIEGVVRRNAGQLLQLGEPQALRPGAIVQNLDIGGFEEASRLDLQPIIIEQTNEVSDGLVRDWPRPSAGADKHLGYAFQWYGLAVTALLFFVATGIKRGNKAAG